jgi:transposase
VDAGYRGEDRGKDWVEKTLRWSVELVERPRKPAPKEVLMAWAEQWLHEGVVVDWQKLMPPKGFVVLPRRWVVERFLCLDWLQPKDGKGLREAVCQWRSVSICCHESPHAEAVSPLMRLFHTVSEKLSEKGY